MNTADNRPKPIPAAPVTVALVTGGSRGLGKAMVLALADRGVDSIFTYRSAEAEARAVVAEVEKKGRRAVALRLDVADSRSFGAFAETVRAELGRGWKRDRFDALVNNAGIAGHARVDQVTEAQLDELVAVHFKGTVFLTQKLLPLLVDGGRIVNVSSGLARFSMPGFGIYAAMKGAVEVLTRYMAAELGAKGIRVNAVSPGPLMTRAASGIAGFDGLMAAAVERSPMHALVTPEDIGALTAFLVSDAGRLISGGVHFVDAGYNIMA